MKTPTKYLVIAILLIVVAVVYGQQKNDAELRISRLQQAFDQLKRAPRSMEQVTPAQDQLLERIVDEVIFLHRENIALRQEIVDLRSKK